MKSKLALYLATLLFFNIILPVRVHAAVVPDISQVTAVWDSNIDTSWDHVYNEYKTLNPQSRYEADKVIAANAYRFLISIGSKPLEGLNQQKFDDFLRAVSPFNIAYNNVLAEQVVHAAWTISGEQYKVFCANVIHNIASNPDYYNTHVIKNDPFVNGAGQQSLQVQYNDVDIDQSLNITNNIFNNNVLFTSGSSVITGDFFNPLIYGYTGPTINRSSLDVYLSFYNYSYNYVFNKSFPSVTFDIPSYQLAYQGLIDSYFNDRSIYTRDDTPIRFQMSYSPSSNYLSYSIGFGIYSSYRKIDLNYLTYPINDYYFNSQSIYYSFSGSISRLDIENFGLDFCIQREFSKWFNDNIFDYFAYIKHPLIYVQLYNFPDHPGNYYYYTLPVVLTNEAFVSPQFKQVNIYGNQYYGSDDDTYFHVDQMVDNIINNDYSTVNNGSNNTFYNDNYYITQPVSGGGIELVTSSSIVYNYITIINNGVGNTSGGSIGSYPYPFDVRIINPEDIKNETEVNTQNEIINNYDLDINAGNLMPTITTVKNTAVNNLNEVAPTTGSSIAWIPFMFNAIPSDLRKIILTFLIVAVIVCVYHNK